MSQIPNHTPVDRASAVGEVQVIFLGALAPHWECKLVHGDPDQIQAFVDRVDARLRFVTATDPQFRRNRERVKRDAERENLFVEWIPEELDMDPERR